MKELTPEELIALKDLLVRFEKFLEKNDFYGPNAIELVLLRVKRKISLVTGEKWSIESVLSPLGVRPLGHGCGTAERLLVVDSNDIPPDLEVPSMDQPPGEGPPEFY